LFSDEYNEWPMPADTYAYACMAFEVLTGQVLFQAPNELATINTHLAHDGYSDKLRALSKTPGLGPLCDLIANALRQRPNDRISVSQFRDGLNQLKSSLNHLSWPLRV